MQSSMLRLPCRLYTVVLCRHAQASDCWMLVPTYCATKHAHRLCSSMLIKQRNAQPPLQLHVLVMQRHLLVSWHGHDKQHTCKCQRKSKVVCLSAAVVDTTARTRSAIHYTTAQRASSVKHACIQAHNSRQVCTVLTSTHTRGTHKRAQSTFKHAHMRVHHMTDQHRC